MKLPYKPLGKYSHNTNKEVFGNLILIESNNKIFFRKEVIVNSIKDNHKSWEAHYIEKEVDDSFYEHFYKISDNEYFTRQTLLLKD